VRRRDGARTSGARAVAIGAVVPLLLGALVIPSCGQPPAAAPAAGDVSAFTPVLSVKEMMEHIVDPIADWIFDAAVVDISEKGIIETKPLTEEDWLKVERGALILAESANLLKMPRTMVPAGDKSLNKGPGGPELTPAEIEAKVKKDPAAWNQHADGLRTAALESLAIIKTRDPQELFSAGDKIDKACEACHLEYWYPGDKKAVLENERKTVTYEKPKK
jgi:hypothetical protein